MKAALFGVLTGAIAIVFAACGGDDEPEPTPSRTPTGAPGTPASATAPASTAVVSPEDVPALSLEEVARGYSRPTFVTHAGDGSDRLFVLEKPGRIRILKAGQQVDAPFLDITSIVRSTGNEQGLLGLAFHPDFSTNGRFFVAYTALNSANTVAEYRVTQSGGDRADASTARVLFAQPDQYANHNGGMLAFGPDGYLYISMGDGGSGGDPDGNGQKLTSLLGKLLRIDIDSSTSPYGIPADNPYTAGGQRGEIWAYGLRNPWRFTFDRETGDVWIADVGQNKLEEIDFQPADSAGGENYGWNVLEGSSCYKPASNCDESGKVAPIFEYGRGDGCSVTGGYVYRGEGIAGLQGAYLFTDYCSGNLWATTRTGDGGFDSGEIGELPRGVSSFGEDEAGELYVTVDGEGAVYRIVAD